MRKNPPEDMMPKFKRIKYMFYATWITLGLVTACQQQKKTAVDGERVRAYASDLINRALYQQAVEQYEIYLRDYDLEEGERANINYIIAETYFERIRRYDNALAYYLKVKHFYPESNLIESVNKRIIACLERLERSADAQQALDETVALDPSRVKKSRPGAVVAKIGDREITMGDLNFEIDQLPPSVRDQFSSREKKLEFLREYVSTELMYDTAKRAELDKDPEVIEGAFQARKMLMVRKLIQDRVAGKIDVNENDVELYYKANKENYAEKDKDGTINRQKPFSEVRDQVAQDLYREKYQQAYQELIQNMIKAEAVQFFENRLQ